MSPSSIKQFPDTVFNKIHFDGLVTSRRING